MCKIDKQFPSELGEDDLHVYFSINFSDGISSPPGGR